MTTSQTVRPVRPAARKTGFNLLELMIVVGLIGLLCAMAIPFFARALDTTRLNRIYHNLRTLDSAKDAWALENHKAQGAVISNISDLKDYLQGGKVNDVIREMYVLNPVGTPPGASLPSGVGLGPYAPGAFIPAP